MEVMGLIINLINGTHDFCERREYAFNVLPEYNIITSINTQNVCSFKVNGLT